MPAENYIPSAGFLTQEGAMEKLGISKGKLQRLMKLGRLTVYGDPLDDRVRLFSELEVDKLSTSGPQPLDQLIKRTG